MGTFEDVMVAEIPKLRAFGVSLSGNTDRADDLVQETMLRAIANKHSFMPGTNLGAWLFTILRNYFRSDYRKRRREVEDSDGSYAKTLNVKESQSSHLDFEDFKIALDKIPTDQREALMLVGASGFSYEDAALIVGCPVGTIKSRVNRARSHLHELLPDEIDPKAMQRYVLHLQPKAPTERVKAPLPSRIPVQLIQKNPLPKPITAQVPKEKADLVVCGMDFRLMSTSPLALGRQAQLFKLL